MLRVEHGGVRARVAELADAADLKSAAPKGASGFDSRLEQPESVEMTRTQRHWGWGRAARGSEFSSGTRAAACLHAQAPPRARPLRRTSRPSPGAPRGLEECHRRRVRR